jgi:hypothetical protein
MTRRFTRLCASAPLLALAMLVPLHGAQASDTVYLCIDANGHKELTDVNKRGCKVMDLPHTFAAPKKWDGTVHRSAALAPSSAPLDFPKVDSAQQKARDSDRRQILDDELNSEEKKLAELRHDFNNGQPERNGLDAASPKYLEKVTQMREAISRSEKNIEALKREIATVR